MSKSRCLMLLWFLIVRSEANDVPPRPVIEDRNRARKYLTNCRYRPEACTADRIQEMENLLVLTAVPEAEPSEVPTPTPAPEVPKKPNPTVIPIKIDKEKIKRTSQQLVQEAERAREHGQLEQALRLYQLAEKVNPEKEEFSEQIQELQKLME